MYCDGSCVYLDEQKHCCKKYDARLGYIRKRGVVSFIAHEKDVKCIAAPRLPIAQVSPAPYEPVESNVEVTV